MYSFNLFKRSTNIANFTVHFCTFSQKCSTSVFFKLSTYFDPLFLKISAPLSILMLLMFGGVMSMNAQAPGGITGGLALWLDASNPFGTGVLPAENQLLNTWFDLSGNNNNATVLAGKNAAAFRSAQINGHPSLNFTRVSDAVGSVYQVAGLDVRAITNPDVTIFTVYRPGAYVTANTMALWGDDNGGWDRFFLCAWGNGTTGAVSLGNAPPYIANVTGAGVIGATRLMTVIYDGSVSGNINSGPVNSSSVYFNGQLITSFTDKTDAIAAQTTFRIGFDGDNSAYNGDIAEMIVFTRRLTSCETFQVNKYLGEKYGQDFGTVGLTVTSSNTDACPNNPVMLTATPGGVNYRWLLNGIPQGDSTSNTYSAISAGQYQVVKTNAENCKDTSAITVLSGCAVTLPVNLISFSATQQSSNTLLEWQTASEFKSNYFIVEQSGNNADWKAIGQVAANRNTHTMTMYSFSHHNTSYSNSFYRLKQVDIDGTFTYSKIISINNGREKLALFPNPVIDKLTITGKVVGDQLICINSNGIRFKITLTKTGANTSEANVSSLPSGLYIINVSGKSIKFLKH